MKRFGLLFLFITLSTFGTAQEILTGFVKNELGEPIYSANIYQDSDSLPYPRIRKIDILQDHFSETDNHGAFHLVYDSTYSKRLIVSAIGYVVKNIDVAEMESPILIALKKDSSIVYQPVNENRPNKVKRNPGVTAMGKIDILDYDFDAFEPLLGKENIDILNRSTLIISAELAGTLKRLHYGFEYGLAFTSNFDPDSVQIELNKNLFALNLGYKLINSKKFVLMSQLSWKGYRYRLINSPEVDDKLPLSELVLTPDLDLRIFQNTGYAGLHLGYKHRGKKTVENAYTTFGVYAGYSLRIHKSPRLSGLRSVASSDLEIARQPLNFGLFVSTNFDEG